MAKVRPCKRGCGYPALPGRQFCQWHALMRQSSQEQALAAQDRLARVPVAEHVARVPKELWPPGERWCAGCQHFIPLFYCSGSRCRACNGLAAHAARVEKTYGITSAEYDALYEAQGGRCAICRNISRSIRFAVDHDHVTGEVRGLLCKRCNHDLLGGGHDDVALMWRATVYLLCPPAQYPAGVPTDVALAALGRYLEEKARLVPLRPASPAALPAPF